MNQEPAQTQPLTAEQEKAGSAYLELFGLQDHADTSIEMMGSSGSLQYGLGLCAHHLDAIVTINGKINADAVAAMKLLIVTKIEQQKQTE